MKLSGNDLTAKQSPERKTKQNKDVGLTKKTKCSRD
jgi:hypothetical protein